MRSQRRAGFESDRWYLDVYDRQTGATRTVFTAPDLSVDEFKISPDGASIWFTAHQDARVNLFVVPFAGGTPRRVAMGGNITAIEAYPSTAYILALYLSETRQTFPLKTVLTSSETLFEHQRQTIEAA